MSTFSNQSVVCACCGKTARIRRLSSTNAMGYCDLDFRPPEMKRSTMSFWAEQCYECGYVSHDLSYPIKGMKETVKKPEYMRAEGRGLTCMLAVRFVRHAMLLRNSEKEAERVLLAMQAYLYAAWACDDEGYPEDAAALRRTAAELLEQWEDKEEPLWLILADLYRRSGQHGKVKQLAETVTLKTPSLQAALLFEAERAEEGDEERYRFCESGFEALPVRKRPFWEEEPEEEEEPAAAIKAFLRALRQNVLDELEAADIEDDSEEISDLQEYGDFLADLLEETEEDT